MTESSPVAGEPIFEPAGRDRYAPTTHAGGPWDPAYLHGGAVSGLLAREVERLTADDPGILVRLQADLLRPVPRSALTLEATTSQSSRSIRRFAFRLLAGDTLVTTASALVVRHAELGHDPVGPEDALRPGPDEGATTVFPLEASPEAGAFHRTGMELRFVQGGFDRPGPGAAWFRFRRPLVGDEPPTPLQTAAAAADFGNGISWTLPTERWVFINPDLTVTLARPPTGEWVGMESLTLAAPVGAGMAESALYDRQGRLGRSVQSLFLDARR